MVMDELVRDELPILESVLLEPLIVLLVRVVVPVVVTTDESMLRVTSPDVPPPDKPVPAVTPVISPGLGATHSKPVAVALLTARIYPLVEATVMAAGVDAPVAETKAPLAVQRALSTKLDVSGATNCQVLPE